MSIVYYLTIDGINCVAANPAFPNSIEVLTCSISGREVAVVPKVGHSSATSRLTEVHIVKARDNISATLAKAASLGKPFKNAVLLGMESSKSPSSLRPVTLITMKDLFIFAFQWTKDKDGFTLSCGQLDNSLGIDTSLGTVTLDQLHLINHLKSLTQQGLRNPQ